jgi:hypothetical protein
MTSPSAGSKPILNPNWQSGSETSQRERALLVNRFVEGQVMAVRARLGQAFREDERVVVFVHETSDIS